MHFYCLGIILVVLGVHADYSPPKRFEYKFSIKPPHISQLDGSIPFFERFGNAIAGADNIRITPSLRAQKGSIWSKNKTDFEWWEVELTFRVTGRGRVGADGLAFWYIEEKGKDSSVFGGPNWWKGLVIFFDSFDNDMKNNNPYIMAMVNDGTKLYEHYNDGFNQKLAGCIKDYRNKPFPLKAKIRLHQNVLTVYFNNGMNRGESDAEYELCLRADNLNLEKFGYFGVSAATGGLADDHDVQKLLTYSIKPEIPDFVPDDDSNTNPDQLKYDKQLEEYQAKLKQQKEEYRKEHPDADAGNKGDTIGAMGDEQYYEEQYSKELRAIFQEQSSVKVYVITLIKQLDEILGKHESITLAFNKYHSTVNNRQLLGNETIAVEKSTASSVTANYNVIERYETDNLLTSNKELLNLNREIRELLRIMGSKSVIHHPPTAEFPGIPSADPSKTLEQINDDVNSLKHQVNKLVSTKYETNVPDTSSCPIVGCMSTKTYVSFSLITTGMIIGYFVYKDNFQPTAKKFY